MATRLAVLAAALVGLAACVTGMDPPAPTPMVEVRAGLTFLFGSETPCYNKDKPDYGCPADNPNVMPKAYPALTVDLKPFAIDEHEVTNFQYQYCEDMGSCTHPKADNTVDIDSYFRETRFREYPVVYVTATQAEAYCRFVGRRLPNEIEWERVAAGPDPENKRVFAFDDGKTIVDNCKGKAIKMRYCDGLKSPAQVESSANDYVIEVDGAMAQHRIYDLGANVSEWVAGFFREDLTCDDGTPLDQTCDCFSCTTEACRNFCFHDCKTDCGVAADCPANCCGRQGVVGHDCPYSASDCFRMCPSPPSGPYPNGLPICVSRGSGTLQEADLVVASGSERLARGASSVDDSNATCRARTTDRGRHFAQDQSQPYIGFRCAADL